MGSSAASSISSRWRVVTGTSAVGTILLGILVGCVASVATRMPAVVLMVVLLVAVGAVRGASELVSLPIDARAGTPVQVVTWNLKWDLQRGPAIADPLL